MGAESETSGDDYPICCMSRYVQMQDGVCIALSEWCSSDDHVAKTCMPAVLVVTRYWRAINFRQVNGDRQAYYPWAVMLAKSGYRLVVADARGTGASFGSRHAEVDRQEVNDIAELIDWVSKRPWCSGQVATHGTSYSGITTLYSLATAPDPLKLGICRAPDFDMYRHLIAPGGIVNHWFAKHWGLYTAAQDANDVQGMFSCGYIDSPDQSVINQIEGVLPVDADTDKSQLIAAVKQHAKNFNLASQRHQMDYIDGFLSDHNPGVYDPAYHSTIDHSGISLVIRCGWHDAATALGALSLFATFSRLPVQLILGPFNHEGTYIVDPFKEGSESTAEKTSLDEGRLWRIDYLNRVFQQTDELSGCGDSHQVERCIHYYTLGESRWKKTSLWPPERSFMECLYLQENAALTTIKPTSKKSGDAYKVNPTTTTGRFNRWHAQSADQPIYFPDRQLEDKKLLVYETSPLETPVEITGHPLVTFYIRSSSEDFQLFVYLEVVDPNGRVRLLTEGQLRALHHKISSETPPYRMFGPYHSLKKKDATPLVPGEVTEISFDLLPLSVLLEAGQKIRLAIAGADKDTFKTLEDAEATELIIERTQLYPSKLEIPFIAKETL